MASVKIPAKKKPSPAKPPKFVITSHVNNKLTLPRAPLVTEMSSIGQNWSESERAGREAVMRRTSKKSKTFTINFIVGTTSRNTTFTTQLRALENFANTVRPVKVTYTSLETGMYYITDFSYTVEARSMYNNLPSRASVSMTFRKAVTESIKVGAIKKPVKKATPVKKKKKVVAKKKVRTHKMKKGDTLWDLARKYYGNPYKWKKIADANKIKNVRRIPIGKVVKIP